MRAMIIGAGGYIGARLAAELERRGSEVIAVSSRTPGGIDPQTGRLPDDFSVPRSVEAVYDLAQSPRRPPDAGAATHMLTVNVVSAAAAADAARKAGVRRFIYTSTGNVYAPGFAPCAENAALHRSDPYALSKIQAEEVLALFRGEMEITMARLFGIYGPGQTRRLIPNLIEAVREGRSVILEPHPRDNGDGGGLRISLCHVEDAVRMLCALAAPGRPPVLNVASDEVLSIREIATAVGRCLERAARFEMALAPRAADLIADITLLRRELTPTFTRFEAALRATLDAEHA